LARSAWFVDSDEYRSRGIHRSIVHQQEEVLSGDNPSKDQGTLPDINSIL